MSRKTTGAWSAIHSMCEFQNIDEKILYEKAKLLLSIYRRVCWCTIGRVDAVAEDVSYYCGADLDGALIYLETFAPDREKERFEAKIRTLFETRWMVELVDTAMIRLKDFPEGGEQYFEILSKTYLYRSKFTESKMLELLNMERSRYYDRKKEAIMVFGLSLWGSALPELHNYLREQQEEMQYMEEFEMVAE